MSSVKTSIEWTNATWNPVRGCSRVSEGCRNCYAEKQAARIISCERGRGVPEGEGAYDGLLAAGGQWNGKVRLVPEALEQPKHWKKPRRIFVNSMADLFHENVPDEFIDKVFTVMESTSRHTFQILTKRPERMLEYVRNRVDLIKNAEMQKIQINETYERLLEVVRIANITLPKNIWLGISVECQKTANKRIPYLLQTPASVRWMSAEPLLGEINLNRLYSETTLDGGGLSQEWFSCITGQRFHIWADEEIPYPKLDWVVVGGESGKEARPMHPDWVRSLRDQCVAADIAFLFKQWGEWAPHQAVPGGDEGGDIRRGHVQYLPGDGREPDGHFRRGDAAVAKVGKKAAGRLLDGVLHDQYPGEQA